VQPRSPLRTLADLFVAFVVVMLATGLGSILGLVLYYGTGLRMLLYLFVGPTYLFFILVGLGLGYVVNRSMHSNAAPLMWILPAIWSIYMAAHEFNTGIHKGEGLPSYLCDTLLLGHHEMGLISELVITAPFVTAVAFSIGAWLAVRRPQPSLEP
jgi:hypothetical protein